MFQEEALLNAGFGEAIQSLPLLQRHQYSHIS
jgi:hypothetical protein